MPAITAAQRTTHRLPLPAASTWKVTCVFCDWFDLARNLDLARITSEAHYQRIHARKGHT